MKKTFVKMFGCAALVVASSVALNACSGENGVDGVNGKDGVDGKDGQDGVSVTDTLYVFQKDTVLTKDTVIFAGDTIYISKKDTVLVKDTVILAGDTIVISKKDTVVVNNKDTVYIANGGSGSGNGDAGTGGNTSFGTLVDERDGQTYRTTKIGDQVWMAENLNFPVKNSYCYDGNLVNCETYGRLYTWSSAQYVCPSGWHLPSTEEFKTLLENVGESDAERFDNLAARSWKFGTNPYGFSALPAGYNVGKEFDYLGSRAYFWSSTEGDGGYAYNLRIYGSYAYVGREDKSYGHSVRCLQD